MITLHKLLAATIFVFIAATVFVILNSQKILSPNVPMDPETVSYGPVTIEGHIGCLPKKGTGAQTLECAFGLRDSSDRYYGLLQLDKFSDVNKLGGGQKVIVSGNLSESKSKGPDGNEYDIVGTITIERLEVLDEIEPPANVDE